MLRLNHKELLLSVEVGTLKTISVENNSKSFHASY